LIGYVFFGLVIVLRTAAMLLEKFGISQIGQFDSFDKLINFETLSKVVSNFYIMSGIACSVLALIFWFGALSHFKVSYLVPLGGLSYILVAVLAYFTLGESISGMKWAGILLIVLGVFFLNR